FQFAPANGQAQLDFPKMGLDADGVYVAVRANGDETLLSVPKNDLLQPDATVDHATLLSPSGIPYRTFPVVELGGTADGKEPVVGMNGGNFDIVNLLNTSGPGPATIGGTQTVINPAF